MKVPHGWVWASLESLGDWGGGGTPSKENSAYWVGGHIPWVSPKDMKVAHLSDSEDHITESALTSSAAKLFPAGAVLVVTRSGILEHTFPVSIANVPVTINQDLKALLPASRFSSEYIAKAFKAFGTDILNRCKKDGTTVASIEFEALKKYKIPIAPEAEQHRIVDALDSYLSRLDAAQVSLARVQAKLKAYRASVLKAAVEGRLVPTEAELARQEKRDYEPASVLLARILKERRRRWEEAELARLTKAGKAPKDDRWKAKYEEPEAPDTTGLPELPEGWCWARFEQLTSLITSGSRGWAEFYSTTGAIFVRAQDINTDRLVLHKIARVSPPEGAEGARTAVKFGDILITITGANVTKTAVVEQELGRAFVSQHVALCRLVSKEIASYIHAFIICPTAGRGYLEKVAYGAGKPGLNLENINQMLVAIPPIAEMIRIVDRCEELISIATSNAEQARGGGLRLARLRQSILKWAFEGKLVDQDPSDEPAEKLLERIRAERAGAPGKRGRGKAKAPVAAVLATSTPEPEPVAVERKERRPAGPMEQIPLGLGEDTSKKPRAQVRKTKKP